MDYIKFFKNKKVTVMGLGLLGRGVGDAKFLAECGAHVLVTDIKKESELDTKIKHLSKLKSEIEENKKRLDGEKLSFEQERTTMVKEQEKITETRKDEEIKLSALKKEVKNITSIKSAELARIQKKTESLNLREQKILEQEKELRLGKNHLDQLRAHYNSQAAMLNKEKAMVLKYKKVIMRLKGVV